MKKIQFFLLFGLVALGSTTMKAQDIYLYNASNPQVSFGSVENVCKIAFTTTGLNFTAKDGSTKSFALADFDYFTTFSRTTTGVGSIMKNEDVSIAYNGKSLVINSDKNISNVTIYSTGGILLETIAPKGNNVTRNISNLAAGIYFVKVSVDGKEITQKIIK